MTADPHSLAAIETLMREVTELRRRVSKGERATNLQNAAIDSGSGLSILDPATGAVAWQVGADENGVILPQVVNEPDPIAPSAPTVEPTVGALTVTWDGLDVEGAPASRYFSTLRVHASVEEDFEPSEATFVGSINTAGGSVAIALDPGTWYVRTEIVTLSGKVSPASAVASAELKSLVDEESIAEELALAADELAEAHNLAMDELALLDARVAEGNASLTQAQADIEAAKETLATMPSRMGELEAAQAAAEQAQVEASAALNTLDQRLSSAFQEVEGTAQAAMEAAVAAALLRIDSSRGTAFKNNTISTVLSVTIFYAGKTITNITELHEAFGLGAYLEWFWRREEDETFGLISSSDNRLSNAGFSLTVSPADVDEKTVFQCQLNA